MAARGILVVEDDAAIRRGIVDALLPSFKFKGTVSPMSLEQTLRSTLSRAMPALMNSNFGMSNAMFNRRAGERFEGEGAPEPVWRNRVPQRHLGARRAEPEETVSGWTPHLDAEKGGMKP